MKITPMWKWKPAVLRRLALLFYVPLWVLWTLLGWLIVGLLVAAIAVLEEYGGVWRGRGGAVVWIGATWRGEHVGHALYSYIEKREYEEPKP